MPGRCEVPWCDQGERPHTIHEWTVCTLLGTTRNEDRTRSVQLVVFGRFEPRPMLAIVDANTQVQTDVVLDWPVLATLLGYAGPARERVERKLCTCPPNGPDSGCPIHGPQVEEFIPEPDAVPPF